MSAQPVSETIQSSDGQRAYRNPASGSGLIVDTDTVCFSGIAAEIIAGGDGAMTVMLMTVSPGHGAPPHISLDEDKVFLVLKGTVTFLVQDTRIEAKAGDRIAVGRGDVD